MTTIYFLQDAAQHCNVVLVRETLLHISATGSQIALDDGSVGHCLMLFSLGGFARNITPRAAASIFPTSCLLTRCLVQLRKIALQILDPSGILSHHQTETEPLQKDQYKNVLHMWDFCPRFLNCLGLRVFSNSAAIFSYLTSREHQRIELSPCL